jgi:hypothetical protein
MSRRRAPTHGRNGQAPRAMLGIVLGSAFLVSSSAAAQPVAIWYRSGEGCPDGAAFLLKLAERAAAGHLAGQGDTIDFVVTLGSAATESWGRLERQTSRGTVGLRELSGSSCEAVANALALTLALTLAPDGSAPPPPEPAGTQSTPPLPVSNTAPPAAAELASPAAPVASVADSADLAREASAGAAPSWRLGLQGLAWTLLGSEPLWGAGAFVDLALGPPARGIGLRPSFRLGAVGALPQSVATDIELASLGARFEGCPLALDLGSLQARPCLGLEGVAVNAESSAPNAGSDTAWWWAFVAHGRLTWTPTPPWAFEAQLGLIAPLGQHELIAESPARAVARTQALGASAGLGVSLRLP